MSNSSAAKATTVPSLEKAIQDYSKTMDMAAPRYQLWQPVTQKGTYVIDETYRAQTSDPLCMSKPKQQFHVRKRARVAARFPLRRAPRTPGGHARGRQRKERRTHQAANPAERTHLLDTDHFRFPDEKSGTSTGILPPMFGQQKSITAVIPGNLRSASGTQCFKVDGAGGEGGTLIVKWQFSLSSASQSGIEPGTVSTVVAARLRLALWR